jgi:hypothetical protein
MSHKYSKGDYLMVAAVIRDRMLQLEPPKVAGHYAMEDYDVKRDKQIKRGILCDIALDFARIFRDDSPTDGDGWSFDPVRFLDACSSNTELYPLSELWDEST